MKIFKYVSGKIIIITIVTLLLKNVISFIIIPFVITHKLFFPYFLFTYILDLIFLLIYGGLIGYFYPKKAIISLFVVSTIILFVSLPQYLKVLNLYQNFNSALSLFTLIYPVLPYLMLLGAFIAIKFKLKAN